MDEPLIGKLLVAAPQLEDLNFARAVVLMIDHNDDGALGLVLNRATQSTVLEALPDWSPLVTQPDVVFEGGPVAGDAVIALGLARMGAEGAALQRVVGRVGVIDLRLGPERVAAAVDGIRMLVGYSGWSPGQVEHEIERGDWLICEARSEDAFASDPDRLWHAVLRRQTGRTQLLSTYPRDPSTN